MRNCGVLQIEPTDFCNLTCPMCHPQQGFRTNLHGDLAKGYMDVALYRQIIDGIERSDVCFDHVIFQWLGDPSLHPELFEMLDYAIDALHDRVGYFRIDTNAILLTADRVDQLVEAYRKHPGTPVLVVFSLDSITRETYRKVKGRDYFDVVMDNVHGFLRRRGEIDLDDICLNAEFQFVLQSYNAHEARQFIEYWDAACAEGRNGLGYNDIMVKRLSVGTGGAKQREADALYARTIEEQKLVPFDKPHIHMKLWMERAWEEHDDPDSPASDLDLGETGMAKPNLAEANA
jgi:sulfatase maturation enzyme AslB (radical SAM superfamily)